MFLLNCILGVCALNSAYAQDSNCDYQQNVEPGQTYYVYNPEYPNNYSRGIKCRWIAKCPAGYNCRLECPEIRMPYTQDCSQDRLLISKSGDPQLYQTETYCGTGSVTTVSTKQALSVGLIVPNSSPGGKFMCRLTAQPATPSPDTCRCGWKKSNRIVGGEETGINEFPMMAGIVDRTYTIKCGAVIISERYLLTAAHCVGNKTYNDIAVVVGEHDVDIPDSTATKGYGVSQIIKHPKWDPVTDDYDIAVLKTATEIVFSDQVGPVCLPFKFVNNDLAGKTVTALGWGTIFFGGPDSNVLMKVDLNVLSQDACRAKNPLYLSQRQMCTYTRGQDACQDDSGGPLLYTDSATGLLFNFGVISFGRFCASNDPGVSTRVTEFLEWIKSVTNYNFCRK